jgi:hypothetical protein
MTATRDLLEHLTQAGLLAEPEAGRVRRRAAESECAEVVALRQAGLVDDDVIHGVLVNVLGVEPVALEEDSAVDLEALRWLPRETADAHLVLPLRLDERDGERVLVLAMADPLNRVSLRAVEAASGLLVVPQLADPAAVAGAIERHYPRITTRLIPRRTASGRHPWDGAPQAATASEGELAAYPKTAPGHRLEDEASPVQLVEALLAVLEAKGVLTRAELVEALKQLLKAESEG